MFTVRLEQHFHNCAGETSGCNCWFVGVGCGQAVALWVLFSRRDLLPRRSSGLECSRLTDLCVDSAEFIKVKCGHPSNDNNWDGWSVSVPDRERLLILQGILYWYLMILFLLLLCLWSRWCRCKGKLLVTKFWKKNSLLMSGFNLLLRSFFPFFCY